MLSNDFFLSNSKWLSMDSAVGADKKTQSDRITDPLSFRSQCETCSFRLVNGLHAAFVVEKSNEATCYLAIDARSVVEMLFRVANGLYAEFAVKIVRSDRIL